MLAYRSRGNTNAAAMAVCFVFVNDDIDLIHIVANFISAATYIAQIEILTLFRWCCI